jgi:hypothetical protein
MSPFLQAIETIDLTGLKAGLQHGEMEKGFSGVVLQKVFLDIFQAFCYRGFGGQRGHG